MTITILVLAPDGTRWEPWAYILRDVCPACGLRRIEAGWCGACGAEKRQPKEVRDGMR